VFASLPGTDLRKLIQTQIVPKLSSQSSTMSILARQSLSVLL
jgi:hypothetical protein